MGEGALLGEAVGVQCAAVTAVRPCLSSPIPHEPGRGGSVRAEGLDPLTDSMPLALHPL